MKTKKSERIGGSPGMVPQAPHDHIQGPIDAPFTLVEYGDFECPYCGAAYPILREVQAELGDQLCFAFRYFPLVNAHPHAERAAEAAEAAAGQQQFWPMHDLLFENQTALEDEDLVRYAERLRLDTRRFYTEIEDGVHLRRVRDDFRSGVRSGVNGTPTLFVNGVRFDSEPDVDALLARLTSAHRR